MLNKNEVITIAGGHTPLAGARGCGFKEEVLAKELVERLTNMFNENSYKAYDVTPGPGMYTVASQLKTEVANANKYTNSKLHLCIHFNAFNTQAHGTETWIYAKGGNAEKFAIKINNELVNLGYTNRGVKVSGTSLYVPRYTTASCCLVEVCFIDNQNDMNRYNLDNTTKAIYKAVTGIEYQSNSNNTSVYRVICGSYSIKTNAQNRQSELKAKGFDSFLSFENNPYRVVCGSYNNKDNAEKQKALLLENGFDSFIESKN